MKVTEFIQPIRLDLIEYLLSNNQISYKEAKQLKSKIHWLLGYYTIHYGNIFKAYKFLAQGLVLQPVKILSFLRTAFFAPVKRLIRKLFKINISLNQIMNNE